MKFLYILRHAKASKDNPLLSDHQRPLNETGLTQAPIMGKLILKNNIVPNIIISSTATRALETAELVASACNYQKTIEEDPKFYEAELNYVIHRLQKISATTTRVLIVGHNPEWEELIFKLTGQSHPLSTGALAEISLDDWNNLPKMARLSRHWSP